MSYDQDVNSSCLQQYEAAYLEHYTNQDLKKAFNLYRSILASYPDSMEAGYSRSQLLNIINSVIPKHLFLDAQVELLVAHFNNDNPPDVELDHIEGDTDASAKR